MKTTVDRVPLWRKFASIIFILIGTPCILSLLILSPYLDNFPSIVKEMVSFGINFHGGGGYNDLKEILGWSFNEKMLNALYSFFIGSFLIFVGAWISTKSKLKIRG